MKALIQKIKKEMLFFVDDAEKTDNKAAARRARKLSLSITKDLKEFRAKSIK